MKLKNIVHIRKTKGYLVVIILLSLTGVYQNCEFKSSPSEMLEMSSINNSTTQKDMISVETLANLKELQPKIEISTVIVEGYHSRGDGGGGIFTLRQSDQGINLGTRIASRYSGYLWERVENGPINVKWFGADGNRNGTRDDTVAIQNAIDTAFFKNNSVSGESGVVYFPGGTYRVSKLVLHPAITIFGDGMTDQSIIKALSTNQVVLTGAMITDDGNASKIQIRNIQINGNNQKYSSLLRLGRGEFSLGSDAIIDGVWVRDAPDAIGFDFDAKNVKFRNMTSQNVSIGLFLLGIGNQINNLCIMEFTDIGIRSHCDSCTYSNTHIEAPLKASTIPVFVTADKNSWDGISISLPRDIPMVIPNLIYTSFDTLAQPAQLAKSIQIESGTVVIPESSRVGAFLSHRGKQFGDNFSMNNLFNYP